MALEYWLPEDQVHRSKSAPCRTPRESCPRCRGRNRRLESGGACLPNAGSPASQHLSIVICRGWGRTSRSRPSTLATGDESRGLQARKYSSGCGGSARTWLSSTGRTCSATRFGCLPAKFGTKQCYDHHHGLPRGLANGFANRASRITELYGMVVPSPEHRFGSKRPLRTRKFGLKIGRSAVRPRPWPPL